MLIPPTPRSALWSACGLPWPALPARAAHQGLPIGSNHSQSHIGASSHVRCWPAPLCQLCYESPCIMNCGLF